jgi:hypothetical protein
MAAIRAVMTTGRMRDSGLPPEWPRPATAGPARFWLKTETRITPFCTQIPKQRDEAHPRRDAEVHPSLRAAPECRPSARTARSAAPDPASFVIPKRDEQNHKNGGQTQWAPPAPSRSRGPHLVFKFPNPFHRIALCPFFEGFCIDFALGFGNGAAQIAPAYRELHANKPFDSCRDR